MAPCDGRTALESVVGRGVWLQRVLRHIDGHLDDDLDVETLSRVAALSKYHFHRCFRAATGMGVSRYVQLLRMRRAAWRLAFRDRHSITDIALDSGYEAPEAFSRAFRRVVGQSPSQFRRRPEWQGWHAALRPLAETRRRTMTTQDGYDPQVTIVDFPPTPVAVLAHRGDPALIGDSIRRFIAWRKAAGLPPSRSATFNILYGDPAETPPERFRLDLCAATGRAVEPNHAGVVAGLIPGGRRARLRHVGSDEGLGRAFAYLYGNWLPASGEAVGEAPLFLQRVRFFPDVPEHEAVVDIFLPLA